MIKLYGKDSRGRAIEKHRLQGAGSLLWAEHVQEGRIGVKGREADQCRGRKVFIEYA